MPLCASRAREIIDLREGWPVRDFDPKLAARMGSPRTFALGFALAAIACDSPGVDVALSKRAGMPRDFVLGQRVPDAAEATVVGALEAPVTRKARAFARLVRYERG